MRSHRFVHKIFRSFSLNPLLGPRELLLGLSGRGAARVPHYRGEERIRRRLSASLGDADPTVHRIEAGEVCCGALRLRRCGFVLTKSASYGGRDGEPEYRRFTPCYGALSRLFSLQPVPLLLPCFSVYRRLVVTWLSRRLFEPPFFVRARIFVLTLPEPIRLRV